MGGPGGKYMRRRMRDGVDAPGVGVKGRRPMMARKVHSGVPKLAICKRERELA